MNWFKNLFQARKTDPRTTPETVAETPEKTAAESPMDLCLSRIKRGNQCLAEGRLEQAEGWFREALTVVPEYAEGHVNLGFVLEATGHADEAEKILRRGLSLNPALEDARFILGRIYLARGQDAEAVEEFEAAVAIRPNFVEPLEYLSQYYLHQGRIPEVVDCYRAILGERPDDVLTAIKLGVLLADMKQFAEVQDLARRVLQAEPENADGYYLLGRVAESQRRLDLAMEQYEKALEKRPDFVFGLDRLSSLLRQQGFIKEAIACYRAQLAIDPSLHGAYSNLLTALQYDPEATPEEIFQEHLKYSACYEEPLKEGWPRHVHERRPEQRLRIGYLSPDFRDHSVAFFILPILKNHDRRRFEVFCYHDSKEHDGVTDQLAQCTEHFIPCIDDSDKELAARIQRDSIDILVDLTGHFGNNRMTVFARKPAPIQVTWIGYPATTGLAAMDYRITDAMMDPPGATEKFHTERLIRLSLGGAFEPSQASPEVNSLPALSSGGFTFACLNGLLKVNDRVIEVWGTILKQLPHSRLILGNVNSDRATRRLLAGFAAAGVAADRLDLRPTVPLRQFLAMHHEIDLALDPFPYTGGTTSLHSLWMGVPVLTLAGATAPARQGACLMQATSLPQFIAESEETYIHEALCWADERKALSEIRQGLRERIMSAFAAGKEKSSSTVMELENAYREIWAARLVRS